MSNVETDAVTAAELSGVPKRFPRAGKIVGGLGVDRLLSLRDWSAADLVKYLRIPAARAESLAKSIKEGVELVADGKKPRLAPVNLESFLVFADNPAQQKAIDDILGFAPSAIEVRFLTSFKLTAAIKFRYYRGSGSGGGTLYCYSTEALGVAMRYNERGVAEPFDCRRRDCPDCISGSCARQGLLQLRIPALEEARIYNPFQYYLHGNTTASLISQVELYAEMCQESRVPIYAPLFTLIKGQENRGYNKTAKDGSVSRSSSKRSVPKLLLAELPQRALPAGSLQVAGVLPSGDEGCEEAVGAVEVTVEVEEIDLGVEDTTYDVEPEEDLSGNVPPTPRPTPQARPAMPRQEELPPPVSGKSFDSLVPDSGEQSGAPPPPKGKAKVNSAPREARAEGAPVEKCAKCQRACSLAEVQWCETHAAQYDGKCYCYTCQKALAAGGS